MSVDFDPVRLRPNRRRIDPVVVGIIVVLVGIATAVVKPWEGGRSVIVEATAQPAVAAATIAPTTAPAAIVPQPVQPAGPPPPTWSDMAPAVTEHAGWGVAAMVVGSPAAASDAPPATGFLELWSPSLVAGGGSESAYIPRDQQSIVALGVTAPKGAVAQDTRIWRVHDDDRLEWVDAHLVTDRRADDPLLMIQPASGGLAYTSWTGGHYRIDVLTDTGIHRIAIEIPGRFGNVPDPDPWPPSLADLVAARKGDPSVTRQGLFVVVGGVSVDLPATAGPTLDEDGEWLAELRQSGDETPNVAVAHLPRATGLGFMFTEHAVVSSATIRRLAPDSLVDETPAFGGVSSLHGRTPYLVFTPSGGAAWAPGVYAISSAWTDPAGAHSGTWYIELRPGALAGGPAAVTDSEPGG